MSYLIDVNNPLKRKLEEDFERAIVRARIESARKIWIDRRKQAANRRQIILRTLINIRNAVEDKAQRRVSVKFSEEVAVVQIPSLNDYELDIRKNIWGTPTEKKRSILRNKLEFAFEGFDFNNVLEEGEFVPNFLSHTFIHPVHSLRRGKNLECLNSSRKEPSRLTS